MLYESAEQQVKDLKSKSEEQIKLGRVTSLTSGGMPKITINGSNTESAKVYPCIASYAPKLNDVVLLHKQGLTYIVIGSIMEEISSGDGSSGSYAPVDHDHDDRYALIDHNHEGVYSAVGHNHDTAYAAKTHNHDTAYAAKTHTHDSYQYPSTLYYGTTATKATVALGGTGGSLNAYSNLGSYSSKSISYSFIPKTNTGYALGAASYPFTAGYIDYIVAKNVGTPSKKCDVVASTYFAGTYIGNSSTKFTNAYITTVYGTVSSSGSDRRIKDKITDLGEKFKEFFNKLRPVSYVFKTEDTDNKVHTGFIAQEVEEAIKDTDLTDLGIVTQDEGGQYYLNYNEFIAIQTKVIQDLQKRVEALEGRLTEMENDCK